MRAKKFAIIKTKLNWNIISLLEKKLIRLRKRQQIYSDINLKVKHPYLFYGAAIK